MKLFTLGLIALALAAAGVTRGAFEPPSAAKRAMAIGDLAEEPASVRQLLTPDAGFSPITPPVPGDWLTAHFEKGQTFEDFIGSGPNRPNATRRVIYLLPIGEFPEDTAPVLEDLRDYASCFFQLEAKILPARYPHELEFSPRKNPHDGHRQILTTEVLKFLGTHLPPDAFCLLGVTMTDLYPSRSWNFVFGQASLTERVGIYSFARDDPAFSGGERPERPADLRDLLLHRGCKTLAHETAHMFGCQHCIYYDCVVNGSNSLEESDARPQHLCPVCLRKLLHAADFDLEKRYRDLFRFYRGHHWYEEADWVERQLARVGATPGEKG